MTVRSASALTLLVVLCLAASAQGSSDRDTHLHHQDDAQANPLSAFNEWIASYEKAYVENVQEYEHRFAVWLDNLKFIVDYNSKHTSHWLGLNKFADITHDEFKFNSLGYRSDLRKNSNRLVGAEPFKYESTVPPKSVDWREKNAVSVVKNQQQCGSCWAFSTTGSVEGINAIYTGNLTTLSEQELVDCDTTMDHGCSGGLMDFAYDFIIENGGIDTEKDYPYLAVDGVCAKNKLHRHVVTIDGFQDVPVNDEDALLKAVANQPISVAIEADQREFQLYAGGVFDGPCGTALDHGVLVVGYGSDTDVNGTTKPYWIIKNSWGAQWGDAGYIKLVRGLVDAPQGQCGVAMQASFPTKSSPNPPHTPPSPPEPPAPPAPTVVVCDESTSCPEGSTCCCLRDFFGYCFTWACCPLPKATCCEDLTHCCPQELPVCDTDAGRCLKGEGAGFAGSIPWVSKIAATRTTWGRDWIPRIPDAVPAWASPIIHRVESLVMSEVDAETVPLERAGKETGTSQS